MKRLTPKNFVPEVISVHLLDLNNSKELFSFVHRQFPRVLTLITGKLHSQRGPFFKITLYFVKRIIEMNKFHGSLYVVKYLKACSVTLQKFVGGEEVTSLRKIEPTYPFPSLVQGLPGIIPKSHRNQIRAGSAIYIRLWLTLFSIYRILVCPFKPKLNTITDDYKGQYSILIELKDYSNVFRSYLVDKMPKTMARMELRSLRIAKLFSSWKSSPSSKFSWMGIIFDRFAFSELGMDSLFNSWLELTGKSYVMDFFNFTTERFIGTYKHFLESKDYLGLRKYTPLKEGNRLGALAFKEEAAGKLRVFAMVDAITQTLLSPLHDYLFSLLSIVGNDGTFDQNSAVWRGHEKMLQYNCAYSFDLSSATDRLPVSIQSNLLSTLFSSEEFGLLWQTLMVDRDFHIDPVQGKKYGIQSTSVRYKTGQPMGALSSWAMLALTHHLIIQYSWNKIEPGSFTDLYEILGDDVTIFNDRLARSYLQTMKALDVEINLSKSVSSPRGLAFEFAKRTLIRKEDVSPIPLKSFLLPYSFSSVSSLYSKAADYRRFGLSALIAICCPNLDHIIKNYNNRFKIKTFQKAILSLVGSLVLSNKFPLRAYINILMGPKFDKSKLGKGYPFFQLCIALLSQVSGDFKTPFYRSTIPTSSIIFLSDLEKQMKLDLIALKTRYESARPNFFRRSKELGALFFRTTYNPMVAAEFLSGVYSQKIIKTGYTKEALVDLIKGPISNLLVQRSDERLHYEFGSTLAYLYYAMRFPDSFYYSLKKFYRTSDRINVGILGLPMSSIFHTGRQEAFVPTQEYHKSFPFIIEGYENKTFDLKLWKLIVLFHRIFPSYLGSEEIILTYDKETGFMSGGSQDEYITQFYRQYDDLVMDIEILNGHSSPIRAKPTVVRKVDCFFRKRFYFYKDFIERVST